MTVVAMTEAPKVDAPKKNTGFGMDKLIAIAAAAFAAFGAFLHFVGICILQSNLNKRNKSPFAVGNVTSNSYHVYDEQWFHTFFYVAVIVVFGIFSMMGSMADHRLTMMAFLVIGFVYLTSDMGGYITGTRLESGLSGNSDFTVGGPATAFTGCFFMVISWFAMMIQTGGGPLNSFFSK